MKLIRQQRQHVVAIDQVALLIHQDNTVSVAIECDCQVRAMFSQTFSQNSRFGTQMFRPGINVDVDAVILCMDSHQVGPQTPHHFRTRFPGGSIRAIHQDAKVFQVKPGCGLLQIQ